MALFLTKDGIHLRYRTWLPEEPRSVVLLVHGAGEHIEKYEHLGDRLSHEGHAFIVFDLRGFGRSGGQRGHVTYFSQYLDDVDQLVTFFKQQLPTVPFYLVGHSLGGLIVTRYVQNRPDRVNGIILSAPALGFSIGIPQFADRIVRLISNIAPSFSVNPIRLFKTVQNVPYINALLPYHIEPKTIDPLACPRYSFRWLHELLTQALKAGQHAKDVIVPVLCIHGERDPLIPLEVVYSFFKSLTVTEKKWLLVPGAEHLLLHSEQLLAIDTVIQWINRKRVVLPE